MAFSHTLAGQVLEFQRIWRYPRGRAVFHSDSPFRAVRYRYVSLLPCLEQYVCPHGELGKYLHDYRLTSNYFMGEEKGFFDLGDIAALVDPELASWEVVACSEVDWDLSYRFKGSQGKIQRCFEIGPR
ncbi:MAG: hypothetical protein R3C56_19585 [Pirellulaceae bacterium]